MTKIIPKLPDISKIKRPLAEPGARTFFVTGANKTYKTEPMQDKAPKNPSGLIVFYDKSAKRYQIAKELKKSNKTNINYKILGSDTALSAKRSSFTKTDNLSDFKGLLTIVQKPGNSPQILTGAVAKIETRADKVFLTIKTKSASHKLDIDNIFNIDAVHAGYKSFDASTKLKDNKALHAFIMKDNSIVFARPHNTKTGQEIKSIAGAKILNKSKIAYFKSLEWQPSEMQVTLTKKDGSTASGQLMDKTVTLKDKAADVYVYTTSKTLVSAKDSEIKSIGKANNKTRIFDLKTTKLPNNLPILLTLKTGQTIIASAGLHTEGQATPLVDHGKDVYNTSNHISPRTIASYQILEPGMKTDAEFVISIKATAVKFKRRVKGKLSSNGLVLKIHKADGSVESIKYSEIDSSKQQQDLASLSKGASPIKIGAKTQHIIDFNGAKMKAIKIDVVKHDLVNAGRHAKKERVQIKLANGSKVTYSRATAGWRAKWDKKNEYRLNGHLVRIFRSRVHGKTQKIYIAMPDTGFIPGGKKVKAYLVK